MTAFISSHRDTEVNRVALAKVKEDKEREVQDGFDGSWVRIMTLCRFVMMFFSVDFEVGRIKQKHLLCHDVKVTTDMMPNFQIP